MKTTENGDCSTPSAATTVPMNRRSLAASMECLRCRLISRYCILDLRYLRTTELDFAVCRLSELQRLLARGVLCGIGFVSPDNPLYKWMPHDISLIEVDERDSFDAGDHGSSFDQSG